MSDFIGLLLLSVSALTAIMPILSIFSARGQADKRLRKLDQNLQEIEQKAINVGKFGIKLDNVPAVDDGTVTRIHQSHDGQGIESADLGAAADLVKSSAEMSRRQLEDAGKDRKNAATQQAVYFAVSVISGLAGIAVCLYGAYLVLKGQASVGAITALSSAIPIVFTGLLFKRADVAEKRLDLISKSTNQSVERVESMLRVIQALARMQDLAQRERILTMLSLQQMFPGASLSELAAIADRVEPKKAKPVLEFPVAGEPYDRETNVGEQR